MQLRTYALTLGLAIGACWAAHAQNSPPPERNLVQLSGSGAVEVVQDQLAVTLSVMREGPDAAAVQSQLQRALESALKDARESAQTGAMEVRTGNFNLQPRFNREGKTTGWAGTAELVLEGRDFQRISTTATRLQTMTVAGVSFSVSRDVRLRAEQQAQAQAIERFRTRAGEIARAFGFTGYALREVSVSGDDAGAAQPRPMMAASRAMAGAEAPLPVEAGRTTVQVWVRGSVQLLQNTTAKE